MRIVFLSSEYPTAASPGRALFNGHLCNELSRQHQLRVLAPQNWRDPWILRDNHPFPQVQTTTPRFFYPPRMLRSRLHQFMWVSIRRSVETLLKQFRPELIFTYWAHPDGAAAQMAARMAGIPCVNMVGGSDVLLEAENSPRSRQIRHVISQANHLVSVSPNITLQLLRMGYHESRITTVPRGIDRDIFRPGSQSDARKQLRLSPDALVVFGCGRLAPVKDWMLFLDTCAVLAEHHSNIQIGIAGSGPLRRRIASRIQQLGLSSKVSLTGSLNSQDVRVWYQAANCTLMTSHSEGIPNVLLESLSCGTPFVSTDVGGIASIADPTLDRLIDKRCPFQLAEAVTRIAHRGTSTDTERRYLPPTWTESAQQMGACFERVRDEWCRSGSSDKQESHSTQERAAKH